MTSDRAPSRRWLTYLRERSPLPALLAVALAQSLSAHYLFRPDFDAGAVAMSALGIVGLLVLMRLMDELKDEAKDRVAHPDRPLPRGLVTALEVRGAVWTCGLALLGFAAIVAATRAPAAGALYALAVGYAFLMYGEFFVPRLLNANAFVYATSHQLIVIPMYAFAVATSSPGDALSARALWFALAGLGASFAFEVGRKLDPAAHPVLGTYLRLYGRIAATAAIAAALALLAVGAYRVDVHRIVWPFVAIVLVTLPLLFVRPKWFRVIEGAAALLAFVQMLAPTVRHLWEAVT